MQPRMAQHIFCFDKVVFYARHTQTRVCTRSAAAAVAAVRCSN